MWCSASRTSSDVFCRQSCSQLWLRSMSNAHALISETLAPDLSDTASYRSHHSFEKAFCTINELYSGLNRVQAPYSDAMILFMWQDDIIGVAQFIDACLERVFTSAAPPLGDQASDQP